MPCNIRRNTIVQDEDGSIVVTIGINSVRFNSDDLEGITLPFEDEEDEEDEEDGEGEG